MIEYMSVWSNCSFDPELGASTPWGEIVLSRDLLHPGSQGCSIWAVNLLSHDVTQTSSPIRRNWLISVGLILHVNIMTPSNKDEEEHWKTAVCQGPRKCWITSFVSPRRDLSPTSDLNISLGMVSSSLEPRNPSHHKFIMHLKVSCLSDLYQALADNSNERKHHCLHATKKTRRR